MASKICGKDARGGLDAATDRRGRRHSLVRTGNQAAMIDGRNNVNKTLKIWRCSMDNG
jgi:hypothetical protein